MNVFDRCKITNMKETLKNDPRDPTQNGTEGVYKGKIVN